MIGHRQIVTAALAMLLPVAAFAGGTTRLTGDWARDDGAVQIAISPCGGNFCAVNTWVKNPNGREKIGDKLILSLQPAGQQLQGQAFDVRRQMHFKMTITLSGNAMQTSGCVLMGVVCKSAGWTRAD